jgi:protein-tyrosine phosphatase
MAKKNDQPDAILDDWLYLGSFAASENEPVLNELGITDIFSTVGAPDKVFPGIEYTYFDLRDVPEQDLSEALAFVVPYLREIRDDPNRRVFVHCVAGISRSTSMIMAFLMQEYGLSYDDALAFIQSRRPIAQPNHGFEEQLRALENTQDIQEITE